MKNKNGYYVPMTFIVDSTNKYINNQIGFDISKLTISQKGKNNEEYIYEHFKKEIAITKEE